LEQTSLGTIIPGRQSPPPIVGRQGNALCESERPGFSCRRHPAGSSFSFLKDRLTRAQRRSCGILHLEASHRNAWHHRSRCG